MINQPLVPASLSHTGKRQNVATHGRHAAAPKRASEQRNAAGGENPKNRKAGPG